MHLEKCVKFNVLLNVLFLNCTAPIFSMETKIVIITFNSIKKINNETE